MKRYRVIGNFRSEDLSSGEVKKKILGIEKVLSREALDIDISLKKKSYVKDGILFGLFSAIWITAVSMGLNNELFNAIVSNVLLWPFNLFYRNLEIGSFGIPLSIAITAFYWVVLGMFFGWFYESLAEFKKEMREFFGLSPVRFLELERKRALHSLL